MLGHGAPWGHAETCRRAGMPGEEPDGSVDGWMGRQGCWLAVQVGG